MELGTECRTLFNESGKFSHGNVHGNELVVVGRNSSLRGLINQEGVDRKQHLHISLRFFGWQRARHSPSRSQRDALTVFGWMV